MEKYIKTFWLNDGLLDQDLHLSERRQILTSLKKIELEVRATFDYIRGSVSVKGLDNVWLLKPPMPGMPGTFFLFAKKLLMALKNLDVDVFVLEPYGLHPILPVWFVWSKLLRHKKPKFVLDIRTLPVDAQNNWKGKLREYRFESGVRFAFKNFDGITMITEKIKSDLEKKNGKFKNDICVWSSAVDPNLFNPVEVSDLIEDLGFKDRFVIMYHGVLSPNRGLQNSVEAIEMIRKEYPEILLFLLGRGPALEELNKIIRNKKLEDNVLIKNSVPYEEVPCFIKSAHAGILPFPNLDWWNTSSPIKLFEYLAMAKPVIVTDIEAHRVVLKDHKCAFFIKNQKPENIADGIYRLMEKKSELAELGNLGRKLVIENHTWQNRAVKIKKYFYELLLNA